MSSAVTPSGRDAGHEPPASGQRATEPAEGATRRPDTKAVVQRQKERFGGMKFGACFFGWLTATGTLVILTALLGAVGAGIGLSQNVTDGQVMDNAQTVGLVGAIILLVLVFVAYICGGYVAGRMARFNGLKQGLGVWLWAIIATVVVAVLGLVAGNQFAGLSTQAGFPSIPSDRAALTTAGIVTAVVVVAVALVGAILGGLAGMRFHRRVDRADLGFDDADPASR